jgi:hypothetical protein
MATGGKVQCDEARREDSLDEQLVICETSTSLDKGGSAIWRMSGNSRVASWENRFNRSRGRAPSDQSRRRRI